MSARAALIRGALFCASLLIVSVSYAQTGMYRAAEIDGCRDFHCMKCTDGNGKIDRAKCSRGALCNMPNCGHKHGAVMCYGGILFYLRTAEGFPSCVARAESVANQLNEFMARMKGHENCYFTVLDENGNAVKNGNQTPTIWFSMLGGGHRNKVISVSKSDLWGYTYRAGLRDISSMAMPASRLTKELVAQWWAYLLKDHFTMMVLGEKPYLTTYTHCGKVLLAMWKMARELAPTGPIPMSAWSQVVENLSSEQRAHLYLAAQIVPSNFDTAMR